MRTHNYGPAPKMDTLLPLAAQWLDEQLKRLERRRRLGLVTPRSATVMRYKLRLQAQQKCCHCRKKHTTGRYYCPACTKPRTAMALKRRRRIAYNYKKSIKILSKRVWKLERQLMLAEQRLFKAKQKQTLCRACKQRKERSQSGHHRSRQQGQ